jgi:phosphatidylglycerophosphate synthase
MNYAVTRWIFRPLSRPIGRALARTSVTPLQITLVAGVLTVVASIGFALEAYLAAALVTFAAEVMDCVDGDLARLTHRSSKAGAFLDSVLDRWADAALILGIAYSNPEAYTGVAAAALVGSFLVSYTRARAQGLGTDTPEGLGGRDTRVLLIVIGGLTGQLYWALVFVAAVSFATAVQRLVIAFRYLRKLERAPKVPLAEKAKATLQKPVKTQK